MSALLRYLLVGVLAVLAFRLLRRLFNALSASQTGSHRGSASRDSSREVRNASFRVDDIEDASYRDVGKEPNDRSR